MFLRVSKYPPNAIFRNANNYKRATRKRNRLNDLSYKSAAAYVEHAFPRSMLASYILVIIIDVFTEPVWQDILTLRYFVAAVKYPRILCCSK